MTLQQKPNNSTLQAISDTSLMPDDPSQDIRGHIIIDERHALVPVDAITKISGMDVHIDQTREHVAKSPAYDPALVLTPPREYWEPFYGYYGLPPYWDNGYAYPQFPSFANRAGSDDQSLRKRGD
jgi:hypothetical protein